MLCDINKTQEKAITGQIFLSDTAFRFPYFMSVYLITLNNHYSSKKIIIFPKKLISANNSSIILFLISPLTHILLHTYAGSQVPISKLGGESQ